MNKNTVTPEKNVRNIAPLEVTILVELRFKN
jgi:hypothetical protein